METGEFLNGLNLEQWLNLYDRRGVIRQWVTRAGEVWPIDAHEMTLAYTQGSNDDPDNCRKFLLAVESLGHMRRVIFCPSSEDLCFGVGGMPGTAVGRLAKGNSCVDSKTFHAELWSWELLRIPEEWMPPWEERRAPQRATR